MYIVFTDDELRALFDRVRSAYEEHDPGDPESHEFWLKLLMKIEKACRMAKVKVP